MNSNEPISESREIFRQFLTSIAHRPQMYVGECSLRKVAIYLDGFRVGIIHTGGEDSLIAWQQWVEMRFVVSNTEWGWPRILVHHYGDDMTSIARLPELYESYLSDLERLGQAGIEAERVRRLEERYGKAFGFPEETHTA